MEGYMTTQEAAEYLDYRMEYISVLCSTGKLPGAKKMGKKMWIIPEKSVFEYKPGPQGFAAVRERERAEAARKKAEDAELWDMCKNTSNLALCEGYQE